MFDFQLFFKVFQKWPWSNPGLVRIDFVNVCNGFQCFFVFFCFSNVFCNFSNTGARLHFGPKRRGALGQPRPFCSGSFNRVRIHRRLRVVAQAFLLGVLQPCPHSQTSASGGGGGPPLTDVCQRWPGGGAPLGQPCPFCSGSFNRVHIHRRVPMVAQSFWLGVLQWCPHSRESRCESPREPAREPARAESP